MKAVKLIICIVGAVFGGDVFAKWSCSRLSSQLGPEVFQIKLKG